MSELRVAEAHEAQRVEEIVRDPSMQFVEIPTEWDADQLMALGAWLIYDDGVFLIEHPADRAVRVHAYILPRGRGAPALDQARVGISLCFCMFDIDRVEVRPSVDNRAARMFDRLLGFKFYCIEDGHWLGAISRREWQADARFAGKEMAWAH